MKAHAATMSLIPCSLLLLALSLPTFASSEHLVYYIVPSHSTGGCEGYQNGTCFTLEQFANSSRLYDELSLTLNFLPGIHLLSRPITVNGSSNFTMTGVKPMVPSNSKSTIRCLQSSSLLRSAFSLSSLQSVCTIDLEFTGCGFSTLNEGTISINHVDSVLINRCHFVGNNLRVIQLTDAMHVKIQDTVFSNNHRYVNSVSHGVISAQRSTVYVSNSHFLSNKGIFQNGRVLSLNDASIFIDNSLFTNNTHGVIYLGSSHASVINSYFTNNADDTSLTADGGVMYLSNSIASVYNCTYVHNKAVTGGVISAQNSIISISASQFINSTAHFLGGAIYINQGNLSVHSSRFISSQARSGGAVQVDRGNVMVSESHFTNNKGGAVYIELGNLSVDNSQFTENESDLHSGAIFVNTGSISITGTEFIHNTAVYSGGAVYSISGDVSTIDSLFSNNTAFVGGAISVSTGNISSVNSQFLNNMAIRGGAVEISSSHFFSTNSSYRQNEAVDDGGAVYLYAVNPVDFQLSGDYFKQNTAGRGAAIYCFEKVLMEFGQTKFEKNSATDKSILYIALSTLTLFREIMFFNNYGSMFTFGSQVNFHGSATFSNNTGGAINAVQSEIYFDSSSEIVLRNNKASYGGGISLTQSTLVIYHSIEVSKNVAEMSGGGIYAYQSIIEFTFKSEIEQGHSFISSNFAGNDGGGIYAVASTVKISGTSLKIDSNTAIGNGGGIYLAQNTILYLFQYDSDEINRAFLNIANNTAEYGGGIYLSDNTAVEALCRGGSTKSKRDFTGYECFLQVIGLTPDKLTSHRLNTLFSNNKASQSGAVLYGGLLDRCAINPLASVGDTVSNGIDYFKSIVEIDQVPSFDLTSNSSTSLNDSKAISSDPVQVFFCNESFYLNHSTVLMRKGEMFTVEVVAVDQVGNPLNATIYTSVLTESGFVGLKEGQAEQRVGSRCTELKYNVYSLDSSAQVQLYADGPCLNLGISLQTFSISFLPCTCPIGFQPSVSPIDCLCECDLVLKQYQVTSCSYEDQTIVLETNIWIGVADITNGTGYVVQDCPFDYCVDKPFNISLNGSYQIDQQCAHNRSGVLCGECNEELSLVLGTSRCKECSNVYLLLLIPFTIAGIALVVFILLFNITVATGTIHGLIVYANILAANRSIFLPLTTSNFLTVFISWVNLDLGIETCFYDGMNSQAKVLLQLVFPAYLFLLVFLVIILSKYIGPFSKLLSRRNPVAALCTLILLSYSKLVRMIIAALQYTFLDYPDGSREIVWLYDANVQYFSVSHIPRFVVAAMIVIVGGLFTILLFFGQWLPRCAERKIMSWTKNTKYIAFIDTFHAPFTATHRYWLGLLLFALIANNFVISLSSDMFLPVLSAGCTATALMVLKLLFSRIYKCKLQDCLETLFLLNLVILALGTSYVQGTQGSQRALSSVSMSISFVLFVAIICYHCQKYCLKETKVMAKLARKIRLNVRRQVEMYQFVNDAEETEPINEEIYDQLREPDLDILDPVNATDYDVPLSQLPSTQESSVVTYSVIEAIPKSDPDEPTTQD